MKKHLLNIFISSFLAGMLIGIGCIVNVSLKATSPIVGALFFGLGLFLICLFGLFLYTGKIGYVLDNKPKYLLDLLVGLIGNFVGIYLECKLLLLTRLKESVISISSTMVQTKLNDSWYSVLILSMFCGFMIYLAVKGFKESSSGIIKTVSVFVAIAVFILCSYEHCVANVGYIALSNVHDIKLLFYVIIMVIGNSLGSILLDTLFNLKDKTKDA